MAKAKDNTDKPKAPADDANPGDPIDFGGDKTETVPADGPNVVGGEGGEMTVNEFLQTCRGVVAAIKSRDWPGTFSNAGKLLNVFADVFGLESLNVWGGTKDAADAAADLDSIERDVKECREIVGAEMAKGSRTRWDGDAPVSSGAAAPMAATPKEFDPATILLIIEIVAKLVEAIRKRRNPGK